VTALHTAYLQRERAVCGPSARIIAAVNAGRRLANERSAADSWDLEPPLIPVELLAAATPEEAMMIMTAWAVAYRTRCDEIETEFIARVAGKSD
jgi:hypothetical protein